MKLLALNLIALLILSLTCYIIISNFNITKPRQEDEVVIVFDLIRHGDRAPAFWSPELMNGIWDESEIGNLTPIGKDNSREYGINISKLYPKIFSNLQIEVYSTNFDRTKETAKEILIGIFGEYDKEKINIKEVSENLPHTNNDNKKDVKELIKFISEQNINHYSQKLKTQYESELNYINKSCKTNFDNRGILVKISDAMLVSKTQKNINLCKIPDDKMYAIIKIGEQLYSDNFTNDIKNFLISKDLLLNIINTIESKINGSSRINYKLIVAHDSNITPLIRFLQKGKTIDEGKFPKFNANVRFELIRKSDNYYIQIKYNNIPLKIDNNKCIYSWPDFLNILLFRTLEL